MSDTKIHFLKQEDVIKAGVLDIMVAERIYQRAKELKIGQELKLWNTPKWI